MEVPEIYNNLKDKSLCPKCNNKATEPHPCPYNQDIDNDHDTLCTCCDECSKECARDI